MSNLNDYSHIYAITVVYRTFCSINLIVTDYFTIDKLVTLIDHYTKLSDNLFI